MDATWAATIANSASKTVALVPDLQTRVCMTDVSWAPECVMAPETLSMFLARGRVAVLRLVAGDLNTTIAGPPVPGTGAAGPRHLSIVGREARLDLVLEDLVVNFRIPAWIRSCNNIASFSRDLPGVLTG